MSRFLFATMPIVGHVAPIAPVARELINRGHEVTSYTSKHLKDKITATGATFTPLVSPIDFGDGEYNEHFPGRDKYHGLRQVVFDFENVFVGSVEGYVDDLRALIASDHPDALVVDPAVAAGVILSIVDAANGVPVVSGGTTEDKAEVGGRVAYTGVGINLKTSRPTVEQLRTAIFSILRDPSYRLGAAEIQRDFASHDGPAEAADLLEQLAATRKPVLRSAS